MILYIYTAKIQIFLPFLALHPAALKSCFLRAVLSFSLLGLASPSSQHARQAGVLVVKNMNTLSGKWKARPKNEPNLDYAESSVIILSLRSY